MTWWEASAGGVVGQRGVAHLGLSVSFHARDKWPGSETTPHSIWKWMNNLCLLLYLQRFLLVGLCVCACSCGWLVLSCQPLGTQEMEMNHGRQIKRMARAHHILLKTGDDLRQGLSLFHSLFSSSLSLYLSLYPLLLLSVSSFTHLLSPSLSVFFRQWFGMGQVISDWV